MNIDLALEVATKAFLIWFSGLSLGLLLVTIKKLFRV